MSGTVSEAGTASVARTKDGIPIWGGEAGTFVQYEEAALLWEQSLTWEKRYTAGPRLVQELTGAARRLVAGQPAGWVAYRGGVTNLMDHLRRSLGKPRVNEVTDLLAAYFKGTRRKSSESMNDYITRKFEAYMRAGQALKRVAPFYDPEVPETQGEARAWSRRPSTEASNWTWARSNSTSEAEPAAAATTDPSETTATETANEGGQASDAQWRASTWQSWQGTWSNWYGGWQWNSQWQGNTGSWDWSSSASIHSYQDLHGRSAELLPSFIQGWYMLAD